MPPLGKLARGGLALLGGAGGASMAEGDDDPLLYLSLIHI